VGCGAWSAPLLLISYLASSSHVLTWSIAFYLLALFLNYPHYMATIYRAYHTSEDFRKYRIFTVHTTALIVLTLVLSHSWVRILPWIFTIYLTWSPWHYSGQNYRLFMMFARRAGAAPDKAGRRALYGAFVVSYLILFLGFHTGPSTDPLFLSLGIPAVVSRWEQIGLGVMMYGQDYDEWFPMSIYLGYGPTPCVFSLFNAIDPYQKSKDIMRCPSKPTAPTAMISGPSAGNGMLPRASAYCKPAPRATT